MEEKTREGARDHANLNNQIIALFVVNLIGFEGQSALEDAPAQAELVHLALQEVTFPPLNLSGEGFKGPELEAVEEFVYHYEMVDLRARIVSLEQRLMRFPGIVSLPLTEAGEIEAGIKCLTLKPEAK